jgi:hypothetical protein
MPTGISEPSVTYSEGSFADRRAGCARQAGCRASGAQAAVHGSGPLVSNRPTTRPRALSTEQLESVVNSKHFVDGVGAPAGST